MSTASVSPIDGRYNSKTSALSAYFSEKALMSRRIYAETAYLIKLSQTKGIKMRKLTKDETETLLKLTDISDEDMDIIKEIETKGRGAIPATNHDVKAVEYYIKSSLSSTSMKDIKEMVHFALTSEDVNNIAYGLMIRGGFNEVLFGEILRIYDVLCAISSAHKDSSMLARTHGQPASPTTFGKEMLVFAGRIKEELALLYKMPVPIKLNGATGNYNAHYASYPEIDWINFSRELAEELNKHKSPSPDPRYASSCPLELCINTLTTQIEPHDGYARIFDSIKRINTVLTDLCRDIWRYISDGWITQKSIKGEIGSSAMPHKVNPIDFENAEGNLGLANALFEHFSSKLPISRLQRDLSDSTVLRSIGTAFAHSLIAYSSILKGFTKINIDTEALLMTLNDNPEVLAEAYQNILRAEGFDSPYEMLKDLTRGKKVKTEDLFDFIKKLDISKEIKSKLLLITPENYTGLASRLVENFDPKIS